MNTNSIYIEVHATKKTNVTNLTWLTYFDLEHSILQYWRQIHALWKKGANNSSLSYSSVKEEKLIIRYSMISVWKTEVIMYKSTWLVRPILFGIKYCNIDAKDMHYGKKAPTIHHYLAHLKEEKLITRYRLNYVKGIMGNVQRTWLVWPISSMQSF